MPVATKIGPSGRSAAPPANGRTNNNPGGVLSRIAPLGAVNDWLKCAIFGEPKTGKTRLAATFPKPLLFIGTEDGTASIKGTKGVDFVRLAATSEIFELLDGPVAAKRWASVVLDNGTKYRDMRIAELWASRGGEIPDRKPFLFADKAWKEVWVQAAGDCKDMFRALLALPDRLGINVVAIAQEANFSSPEEVGQSEFIRPAIGSALGKSVCEFVHAECDYNLHTFIREQLVERVIKAAGGKEVRKVEPTGKKEFCLHVGPHEIFWTGFRQQVGAPELPDVVVNPTYDKIVKLIRGEKL